MHVVARAKINWTLDIVGKREDGYHLMDMLMQPVELADELTLEKTENGLTLTVSGYPRVKAGPDNLALRAAQALQAQTGYRGGASIHLHKRIPVGAGLGGGSADAAGVLAGLNRLWETGLTQQELEALGLRLGADVPFCLRGGCSGRKAWGRNLRPWLAAGCSGWCFATLPWPEHTGGIWPLPSGCQGKPAGYPGRRHGPGSGGSGAGYAAPGDVLQGLARTAAEL